MKTDPKLIFRLVWLKRERERERREKKSEQWVKWRKVSSSIINIQSPEGEKEKERVHQETERLSLGQVNAAHSLSCAHFVVEKKTKLCPRVPRCLGRQVIEENFPYEWQENTHELRLRFPLSTDAFLALRLSLTFFPAARASASTYSFLLSLSLSFFLSLTSRCSSVKIRFHSLTLNISIVYLRLYSLLATCQHLLLTRICVTKSHCVKRPPTALHTIRTHTL